MGGYRIRRTPFTNSFRACTKQLFVACVLKEETERIFGIQEKTLCIGVFSTGLVDLENKKDSISVKFLVSISGKCEST